MVPAHEIDADHPMIIIGKRPEPHHLGELIGKPCRTHREFRNQHHLVFGNSPELRVLQHHTHFLGRFEPPRRTGIQRRPGESGVHHEHPLLLPQPTVDQELVAFAALQRDDPVTKLLQVTFQSRTSLLFLGDRRQ
jgi:hypothetical protein